MPDLALYPPASEHLFEQVVLNAVGTLAGPIATRNPQEADRGDQWIRIQIIPLHQRNRREFNNMSIIHVYDVDEDRALLTTRAIYGQIIATRQVTVAGYWVNDSSIDIGYIRETDPELVQYTRYHQTASLIASGTTTL